MKTIGKLKLTQLSKADLEARQMNALRGGSSCACVCGGACTCSSASTLDSADAGKTDLVADGAASGTSTSYGEGFGAGYDAGYDDCVEDVEYCPGCHPYPGNPLWP